MSKTPRAHKRIALIIGAAAAVSILATLVLPATFGAFSATTTNAGNSFQTGTLKMTNSVSGAVVTVASNMKPGDSKAGTVIITNSGSLAANMTISETSVTHGGTGTGNLASRLTLKIQDELGNVIYNSTFDSLGSNVALPNALASSSNTWAAGDSHTYTFTVTFPDSDNTYQDTTASASFVWGGGQTAGSVL